MRPVKQKNNKKLAAVTSCYYELLGQKKKTAKLPTDLQVLQTTHNMLLTACLSVARLLCHVVLPS